VVPPWAAAAVAATDWAPSFSSVLAAALALPGVATAQADAGPGVLSLKWLHYQDEQPGLKRIRVTSPSLHVRAPVAGNWVLEGGLSSESVSGASPRYHSAISGASRMSDERRALDVKVTRLGQRSDLSLGLATSDENDFHSRAVSLQGRWHSDDRNRSWNAAVALTRDRIGSSDDVDLARTRRTLEFSAGLTQALTRADLVQLTLTHAAGHGYYDDPYKRLDVRPGSRHQNIALVRWNHHFEGPDITLRSSWRGYRDSFGIRSHTLTLEPVIGLGARVSVTPGLRVYTQTAARFYYDPVYSFAGAPYPPGYLEAPPRFLSPDARLSAFGAVTVSLKLALQLDERWRTDFKLERYAQRGSWRLGGPGSPGLAPLSATFMTWGLSVLF
jgi:Protein of unknown function (DUF3570)